MLTNTDTPTAKIEAAREDAIAVLEFLSARGINGPVQSHNVLLVATATCVASTEIPAEALCDAIESLMALTKRLIAVRNADFAAQLEDVLLDLEALTLKVEAEKNPA